MVAVVIAEYPMYQPRAGLREEILLNLSQASEFGEVTPRTAVEITLQVIRDRLEDRIERIRESAPDEIGSAVLLATLLAQVAVLR